MTALATPAATGGRRRRLKPRRRRQLVVLGFLSPGLVGFAIFFLYPLVANLYYSFTHYDLISSPKWIGLENYRFMFTKDAVFWPSLRNTGWMVAVLVPLRVLTALGISVMITRLRRGVGLFRTIFYLPTLLPPVAATLGFVFLLNPGTGPVNTILGWLNLPQPLWFDDPTWAKPALVMLSLWGLGNTMVLLLAALLDVPVSLYEAAKVDGAGALQQFRNITLPTIAPVLAFAVVIAVIDALQYFTQAYVANTVAGNGSGLDATNLGYPEGSTMFYPTALYQQGFRYFNMGYASALAMVLFVVSLTVTVFVLRRSDRLINPTAGV